MAATGKVYIYNTTNQDVQMELNQTDLVGRLPANSGASGGYLPVPSPNAVADRSDASSTPDSVFATTNKLEFVFAGTSNTYSPVKIDPGFYPTNTDLILYVYYNYIVLISPANNAIVYSGAPTS